jgi:two-component system, cell cycle sensor histidine kinase and response regulator CckA
MIRYPAHQHFRGTMNCTKIDLNQVIVRQAAGLRRLLGEATALTVTTTAEPATVEADEGILGQILFSLAAAVQASNVTLQTEVVTVDATHAQRQPGAWPGEFIRVSLSGTGERAAGAAPPGTGRELSLPVITGILQRRHGWLETIPHPAGHSTFRCLLPQASPVAAATAAATGERVLLVEDEGDMREMLCHILQRASYDIIAAETGPQALALWTEHGRGVNLLITDMIMPGGVSGRELAHRLRAAKPELKVIYTSGYELEPHAQHDCAIGAVQFLQKPYELLTLLETVQRAWANPGASFHPS